MSPLPNQEAILLRRAPLRETSLLLTWLTRESGRIKTVLRGAKTLQSGLPDLFERHEIVVARSRTSEIHTLREHCLAVPHEGIRKDYRLVALAGYFTHLVESATEPEHPIPEIFDLLARALAHLSSRPGDLSPLPALFERRLAGLLGVLAPAGSRDGAAALVAAGVRLSPRRETLLAQLSGAPNPLNS